MIKKSIHILCLMVLSIASMSFSMQPVIPLTYTLASTTPPQQFTIPRQLVLHSETIMRYINNPRFKQEPCFTVENATPQDVLHLISCLKKIDIIAKNSKTASANTTKHAIAQQTLAEYTSSLGINEIMALAHNTDYLLINNKYLTKSIAQSIGKKIIAHPAHAREIFNATPDSLHKKTMQALNKQASIDSHLMQPYSQLLEATCPIPLLHPQYGQRLMFEMYNNILTTDINYQPCYYNPQTRTTIVKSRSKTMSKVLDLQITKKNATQPIIIDIRDLAIDLITSITANQDESLFICNASSNEKSFVINLNNPNLPLIRGYNHYAFKIDDPTAMYVASEHSFALFDIKTNTFHPINYFPHDVRSMLFNHDQSIVAFHSMAGIDVGKKVKGCSEAYGSFDFSGTNLTCLKNDLAAGLSYIRSISLHPNKDKLFVLFEQLKNNDPICCMIDLKSYKTTLLPLSNEIKYVDSHNISFLSDDILYLDSTHHRYFINIATDHHWKKKQDGSQLLYTTDKSHCLELHSTYSNGRDYEKFKMVPLYNESMSENIALLNKGKFPLLLLNIIQNKPHTIVTLDDDDYKQYLQMKKSALGTILDNVYTITQNERFGYFNGLLRHYCPTQKNLKGWTAAIACGIIGLALYYAIDYYDTNKRLDGDDKKNFIKGLFELILFLAKT